MDDINLKVGNIVKGNSHSPRRSNDIGIIIDKKTLGGKRYCFNVLWQESDIQIYFDYELELVS